MLRRWIWGISVVGLMIGLTVGCRMRENYEVRKMLSYLRGKYKEEFSYVESYAGQPGKPYVTMLAERNANPKQIVLVRVRVYDGNRYYEDNFLGYLLQTELEEKISVLAEKSFGGCKLYYKIPTFVFPGDFPANMSAEAFLKNPYAMPQFYIYPGNLSEDKAFWEKKMNSFVGRCARAGYQIRGTLSIAASKQDYEMIDDDNFAESDYLGYEPYGELAFSMNDEGKLRYMRWIKK